MLGEKIAEQRKRKGITQQELADALNISRSTLAGYEAENKKPSYKVLVRMAEYFGVTVDYLLRSTDTQDFGICDSGNTIKELRTEAGMTQEELGMLLNVQNAAVSKYESGKVPLTGETLLKLSKIFNVSTDYLLGAEGGNTMIGGKIAELRKELELSQEELAERLNVKQPTVANWELDRREPDLETVKKIASLFGVTTDYLLGLAKGGNTMLGKRINELRKSSGMTQEEFGKKLGVIKQTVSSWENDLSEPNHAATIAIAKLFGVTTDYLLGAEGDTMGTEETINEITQRVGRNIRSIREQAGLSEREFAEGFGVSAGAVGMWETGRREPDINMLIQIAHFGGTNLDDLVMKELTPPVPLYVRNMIYLRKKRGYSQGELATVLGLQSASSIDLVESGKCELPVSKLVHLAEFFGVTMDQITKQDLSQEVSGCRQQ